MAKILVADDDASFREVLAFALKDYGHEVDSHAKGESALSVLGGFQPDLVITDLKMPGIDGLEVLRRVTEADATIPVIILTAFGSIEDAVEAMKHGAHHYLTKPYNRDELKVTVDLALEHRRLLIENRNLRDRLREHTRRVDFVRVSKAMQEIHAMVRRIAPSDATVLITGESGTGKEVIANTLHAYSERWEKPFVAVNCAAIPRDLMESELFGYTRGAFTGATKDKPGKFKRADGGTLLLDEVGDLPTELQTKLLRVIETGQIDVVGGQKPVQVDVRLVAATNADLEERVREGHFRSDLFYRLNVIPIRIPPLRERREDIPALWDHFVRTYAGGASIRTTPGLMRVLMERRWAGNVRELANVCHRMVLLRTSDTLDEENFPRDPEEPGPVAPQDPRGLLGELPDDGLPLRDLERDIIVRALAKHGGNRTRTAEYLSIPRHVLIYRIEKFGIE
jgi:two-component system NtrC family response regulator